MGCFADIGLLKTMPPAGYPSLTEEEKRILIEWIELGCLVGQTIGGSVAADLLVCRKQIRQTRRSAATKHNYDITYRYSLVM